MNSSITETCLECGQSAIGGLLVHELYCYDVYIVSAPAPQNPKQREIDKYMTENIVKELELNGLKCYLGSRDIYGGEHVISALSKPITIIPTTIVPVYKDRSFSSLRNLLLRVDYLDRIVFLTFDSTPIEPPAISKNSFSLAISDPHLLSKLIRTINRSSWKIPLHARKRKYDLIDSESASSLTLPEFQRNTSFRRSDTSRISFRVKSSAVSTVSGDGYVPPQRSSVTASPHDLLSSCKSSSLIKRQGAAKSLARIIQKDLANFSKNNNLKEFEKQIRTLRQKENSMDFEKVYFWITAAIFYRIYKYNDYSLKVHMKMVTLSKCKPSKNGFEQLCQVTYYRLTASLLAKMKIWTNRLDNNEQYVKKFEDCLSMINPKSSENTTLLDALTKILSSLPRDIKHIFIVTIAGKLFQKKYTESTVSLFSHICNMMGKKHWPVFIDLLEGITEYMLHTYTKESLLACLQFLTNIVKWKSRRQRRKNDKLNFALKHIIRKLVYHPVDQVRNYVSSLVFGKGSIPVDISQLGCCSLKVNEDLVEECILEHLHHSYPALTIHEQVPSYSPHILMFETKTPEGDSLLYVFRQQTLNDVLNTNSTDAAYESFQEMLKAIKICQGHDNIVEQRNVPSNGVLPFCAVECGKPLLSFLHENKNQLTWTQMLDILIDITKAVHYCHNNNVILREITPASFVIVPKENGSLETKLASFIHAKCLVNEEPENEADINCSCFKGDRTEVIAAYFSAPETLRNKTFSKYSEAWMLAATFYSILLYGMRPYEELAHLNVFQFITEIIAGHTVSIPSFLPEDLSEILSANLIVEAQNRMTTETLLDKLEICKVTLGTRRDIVHAERTVCCYINTEDILRVYVDKEQYVEMCSEEQISEVEKTIYEDETTLNNGILIETVSGRMSLKTKRKLLSLNHGNILTVDEIKSGNFMTILISKAFDGHMFQLSKISSNVGIEQLFSYLEQIAMALRELHSHNIVHCDLRCDHIYINQEEGTVKIGHFGRAVSLEGRQTYAFKMMPPDAKNWSAPEVRASHMYSKASDIFSLAVVFWEAISTQKDSLYSNHPLRPFHQCRANMEEYAEINVPHNWEDGINKMLKCMHKCWNPNQTKRPTVDVILNMIQQIRRDISPYWSTDGDQEYGTAENDQEDGYECIIENSGSDFSVDYAWGKVVKEFTYSQGKESNAAVNTEFDETSIYEDVELPTT